MSTMVLLVAGIIGLCWMINHTFLEEFYIYEKQQSLLETYDVIERASREGILGTESFGVTFENLCANSNLSILVIDAESKLIRSSMWDVQLLIKQVQEMLREGVDTPYAQSQILAYTENYTMMRQADQRLNSDYLVLLGNLQNGGYVYIRSPLESIRESAAITNRFFVLTGLLGVVVSVIVIFFVSKSISRPIKELTDISKAMTHLQFQVKYITKPQDGMEVAELGEHMNFMAYTLEKTISDLKIANNELQQDIEKKEKIDEMRKEFLANVSHELKTPIALIKGYAEGLQEDVNEDPESRAYYCEVIIDEASKMNTMVKKLLTLNQLEFGNDTLEITRFNLTEMLFGLVQANRILADANGITICFSHQTPVYVWGDAFKVEEVLTNYISNAMHHAAGEKRIEISLKEYENKLRVCVYNTGASIPEEEMEKIWMKFYKIDKARTREYGGSGIGLSIVKAIMESMHQAYGVHNTKNGVEFWMELESGCISDKNMIE